MNIVIEVFKTINESLKPFSEIISLVSNILGILVVINEVKRKKKHSKKPRKRFRRQKKVLVPLNKKRRN